MAEVQTLAATAKPLQLAQARLAGRIEATRVKSGQRGKLVLTVLSLPAADKFSHPGTVEVLSDERLGSNGDELSIIVSISGFGRTAKPKDPQDMPYKTADNRLSFVAFA